MAERASAAKVTVDVKAALMADPSVDATRLDVSTDYRTRTVTLNGYVSTATERDAAEAIAQEAGGGLQSREQPDGAASIVRFQGSKVPGFQGSKICRIVELLIRRIVGTAELWNPGTLEP